MLLTSAQVSVALSSMIVSIFTITLFLSGYVLQQRTVTNIREAIKPKVRPIHTFAGDIVSSATITVVASATATALPSFGTPVIEAVTLTTNAVQDIVAQQVLVATSPTDQITEIDLSQPTAPPEEEIPPPSERVFIDEDRLMPSSRIRRPSQVENDKKDKEWAERVRKSKNKNSGKNDIPLEQLSRAERRKAFKHQLSIQEGQQPVDPKAYRPRRRLW